MEITEVRIKLMEEAGDRLQAFCSVTFDDSFVVRDLKIIEGTNGPFVAMPSRKLTSRCPQCSCKNHLRAAYCNQCGLRLKDDRAIRDDNGRAKLYADIAHPINSTCREKIQQRIIDSFKEEFARSQLPGYVPSYDDLDHDDFDELPRESSVSSDHSSTKSSPSPEDVPASPQTASTKLAASVGDAEQPRGPHKPPTRKGNNSTEGSRMQRSDGFVAGIL